MTSSSCSSQKVRTANRIEVGPMAPTVVQRSSAALLTTCPKSFQSPHRERGFPPAPTTTVCFQRALGLAHWDEENKNGQSEESTSWLTQAFSHIEVAPILTLESGRPVDALTGLDSNRSYAFPFSARPQGLGRNSLNTPALAALDFRVLKYFPFGGVKRLDVVAEFFNLFNSANVSPINPIFGSD